MLLTPNTTILTIPNRTAQGQQNSSCIYVDLTAMKISELCGYSVILLGSFFGNIFIIITVYKHRELRKTVNYFIVNMAVSDLLSSLIAIPFQISGSLTDSWYWHVNGIIGSFFCKLVSFANPVSVHVSAQCLVWIAIDRFAAVVFPMKLGLISTKIRTTVILSTWTVAILFNFPCLISFELVVQANKTYCTANNVEFIFSSVESIEAYMWLETTFFSIFPLFLVTIFYAVIVITLKRQSKALSDTAPNVQRNSVKKRRKAIQMAVAIVVMFYICVIPFISVRFLFYWSTSCDFLRLFHFLAMFMLYSSSIVNSVICLSFVKSYRRGLRNILCSCMRNSEIAKRVEMTTPKELKHLPQKNCQGTLKETEDDGETLDTVL